MHVTPYPRVSPNLSNHSCSSTRISSGWLSIAFIGICVDNPKIVENNEYLGVDLGRKDIASLSTGESFSGEEIEKVRVKYSKIRARLQHKASSGTRSSRRRCRQLQKRLAGKERRFQAWLNHNIALQIVLKSNYYLKTHIVLEDLTGIRERTNEQPRTREQRFLNNSWSFYQLKLCIQYKANIYGVPVVLVNPRYTSQTCHSCLHIHPVPGKSYRNGKDYHCGHCGWKGDADFNAANVIKQLGATVNRRKRFGVSCLQFIGKQYSRASESPHYTARLVWVVYYDNQILLTINLNFYNI